MQALEGRLWHYILISKIRSLILLMLFFQGRSNINGLLIFVLKDGIVALYFAVKEARTGKIADHQRAMKGTFIGAMGVAGILAFMPGRMMFEVALEPTLEKLFAGTEISAPPPIFSGNWQIPVITVGIVLLVVLWKPAYRFFISKSTQNNV